VILTRPLITWGTPAGVADLLGGTAAIAGGQADFYGDTSALLITDASAVATQARDGGISFAVDGLQTVGIFLKQGTGTQNLISIFDATASVYRASMAVVWSGGIPALSLAAGAGTIYTPINVGNSFWFCPFDAAGILKANNNRLEIRPANANVAATGTVIVYLRHAFLAGISPDAARGDSVKRPGSQRTQGPSGVQDAFTYGFDQRLRMDFGWIPTRYGISPTSSSGFDGEAEFPGVNSGVRAMLEAGGDTQLLRVSLDQSAAFQWRDCYLTDGSGDPVSLEENEQRHLQLELFATANASSVTLAWTGI
jgi:hypothetical protein